MIDQQTAMVIKHYRFDGVGGGTLLYLDQSSYPQIIAPQKTHCLLTHWGRVMHICVGNLTSIGSDNGLLPGRRQAIIWINAEILLIGALGTNFSEILIKILTFSLKKMCWKVSSEKRRPFCLGVNVLTPWEYFNDQLDIFKKIHGLIILVSPGNFGKSCSVSASMLGYCQHTKAEIKWPPFPDNIFKCIFLNENIWILIEFSLKFVPKGPINNKILLQIHLFSVKIMCLKLSSAMWQPSCLSLNVLIPGWAHFR